MMTSGSPDIDMTRKSISNDAGEGAVHVQRDHRIDFLRGIALLIVLVDHIEFESRARFISHWTLISLGFSDAAEVFVFLSGYVFGLSFSLKLQREGFLRCELKVFYRALQIYLCYVVSAWAALSVDVFASGRNSAPMRESEAIRDAISAFALDYQPNGFAILALYVVILPLMPPLLQLARRKPWIAWTISGGVYLAAQLDVDRGAAELLGVKGWFFNPFAWQFLFFVGMECTRINHIQDNRWLRRALIVVSTAILLLGLLAVKVLSWIDYASLSGAFQALSDFTSTWAQKARLRPFRVIHFLSLAYVVSLSLSAYLPTWESRFARPIIICGQYSLTTYTCGLVITSLARGLVPFVGERDHVATVILAVDACAFSIAFALGLRYLLQKQR